MRRLLITGVLVTLASASPIAVAAAANDAAERRAHIRRVLELFENAQSSRRHIRNGTLSTWTSRYGILRIQRVMFDIEGKRGYYYPANLDEKYRFLTDRIVVDNKGWWRVVKARDAGLRDGNRRWQTTGDFGSWHEDTSFWWADNFWRNKHYDAHFTLSASRRPPCPRGRRCTYGLTITHQWGHKRGYSNPCEQAYRQANPADLYLYALVNKLNATWSNQNREPEDMAELPSDSKRFASMLADSSRVDPSVPPVRWPAGLQLLTPRHCLTF